MIHLEVIIESNRKSWYSREGKKFKKITILFVIQLEIIIESNRKTWYSGDGKKIPKNHNSLCDTIRAYPREQCCRSGSTECFEKLR